MGAWRLTRKDNPAVNPSAVKCESSLPGHQERGTGGTLNVVWAGYRDRGDPPLNGMNSSTIHEVKQAGLRESDQY